MSGSRGTVLVTDAGRGQALAFIRSLGRAGWTVVAADHDRASPGLRSRFAAARVRYPDPAVDPDGVVERLAAACRRHRVDVLVPITDEVLLPLVGARDRLPSTTRVAAPPPDQLALVGDKRATLARAAALGIPVPQTVEVASVEEAREAARTLGWPVVVKPASSRIHGDHGVAAFRVAYAADPDALAAEVAGLVGRVPVLLQRFHRGEGHGVEVLTDAGRLLAAFQHRRLREVPVTGGASSFRESVALDPRLLEHAGRLLADIGWTGLAMVEFRIGPDGPVLMEVNGRPWGSLPLAVRAGMDFPARLLELLVDGPPPAGTPPATTYAVGVRASNLGLDLVWLGSVLAGRRPVPGVPVPGRRAALGAVRSWLSPGTGFDVVARDDPAPAAAEVVRIVRNLARKVRRAAG